MPTQSQALPKVVMMERKKAAGERTVKLSKTKDGVFGFVPGGARTSKEERDSLGVYVRYIISSVACL